MRRMVFVGAAMALVLAGSARAATGSGTVDFTFTGFSGAFAWANVGEETDPATYLAVGTVNGVQPVYDPTITPVPRGVPGQEIIGGTAALSGESATLINSALPGFENMVSFTPVAGFSNVTTGTPFKIGTLTFTNGSWFGGTGNLPADFAFTLTTHSNDTPAFNQTYSDVLQMVTNITPPSESCSSAAGQADGADFLSMTGASFMGSVRVFEAFCSPDGATTPPTGSADVYFAFGSLDPNSFQNPQGDAFLASRTTPGPLGTPEPAAWTMLIVGLGALGWTARRRRAARA